jgi:hypothetical protein
MLLKSLDPKRARIRHSFAVWGQVSFNSEAVVSKGLISSENDSIPQVVVQPGILGWEQPVWRTPATPRSCHTRPRQKRLCEIKNCPLADHPDLPFLKLSGGGMEKGRIHQGRGNSSEMGNFSKLKK